MDETAVETALNADTFDVLAFVEGTAYPIDHVTLFTDIVAAKEYAELVSSELNSEEAKSPEDQEVYQEKLDVLAAKLKATSLTFKVRGFAPGIVDEIMSKNSSDENPSGADDMLVARAIISVTNGAGAQDERSWTEEDVKKLKTYVAEGEYLKLLGTVAGVIFNAAVFKQAADAGFSG